MTTATAEPQIAQSTKHMQCMEIWGGNRFVESGVVVESTPDLLPPWIGRWRSVTEFRFQMGYLGFECRQAFCQVHLGHGGSPFVLRSIRPEKLRAS